MHPCMWLRSAGKGRLRKKLLWKVGCAGKAAIRCREARDGGMVAGPLVAPAPNDDGKPPCEQSEHQSLKMVLQINDLIDHVIQILDLEVMEQRQLKRMVRRKIGIWQLDPVMSVGSLPMGSHNASARRDTSRMKAIHDLVTIDGAVGLHPKLVRLPVRNDMIGN